MVLRVMLIRLDCDCVRAIRLLWLIQAQPLDSGGGVQEICGAPNRIRKTIHGLAIRFPFDDDEACDDSYPCKALACARVCLHRDATPRDVFAGIGASCYIISST